LLRWGTQNKNICKKIRSRIYELTQLLLNTVVGWV
jgi:hypothetical protein